MLDIFWKHYFKPSRRRDRAAGENISSQHLSSFLVLRKCICCICWLPHCHCHLHHCSAGFSHRIWLFFPPSYSSHFHLCLFWFRRGCRVVLDLEINSFVHVLLERNAGAAVQSINRRIKKNFNRTVPRVWANEILFSRFMCFVCYFFPLSLFWRVDLMHSLFCNTEERLRV